MRRLKQKRLRQWLETLLLRVCFGLFGLLPLDTASALGGWMGRIIGPWVPATRYAELNLRMALPNLSDGERAKIIRDMWDNLGRYAAEFPHMAKDEIVTRVVSAGQEYVEQARGSGKASLWISGHFGNWEIMPRMAVHYGMPLMLVYRHANNPLAEAFVQKIRAGYHNGMFGKGGASALRIVKAIKQNQSIGILVDQKMNEGVPVPFFGREAMTSPAFAQMALRYRIPVLLAFVRRTKGAHFELQIDAPQIFEGSADNPADVSAVVVEVYRRFECWIRQNPSQWFWLHRRWPKSLYPQ